MSQHLNLFDEVVPAYRLERGYSVREGRLTRDPRIRGVIQNVGDCARDADEADVPLADSGIDVKGDEQVQRSCQNLVRNWGQDFYEVARLKNHVLSNQRQVNSWVPRVAAGADSRNVDF